MNLSDRTFDTHDPVSVSSMLRAGREAGLKMYGVGTSRIDFEEQEVRRGVHLNNRVGSVEARQQGFVFISPEGDETLVGSMNQFRKLIQ